MFIYIYLYISKQNKTKPTFYYKSAMFFFSYFHQTWEMGEMQGKGKRLYCNKVTVTWNKA